MQVQRASALRLLVPTQKRVLPPWLLGITLNELLFSVVRPLQIGSFVLWCPPYVAYQGPTPISKKNAGDSL